MKSVRLSKIASLINKNDNVIDIGCDHGLLSIELAKYVGCKRIIASDINQNALNNAISNIKKENLENKITTILSDGINNIQTDDFNTIVISGMGTSTILHILSNKEKLKNIKKIIIQSNNDHYLLRKEMIYKGYIIENELTIFENKKYYIIIEFSLGTRRYSKRELLYGPLLIKDESNKNYFEFLYKRNFDTYKKIPSKKILLKLKLKLKLKMINNILKSY